MIRTSKHAFCTDSNFVLSNYWRKMVELKQAIKVTAFIINGYCIVPKLAKNYILISSNTYLTLNKFLGSTKEYALSLQVNKWHNVHHLPFVILLHPLNPWKLRNASKMDASDAFASNLLVFRHWNAGKWSLSSCCF